MYAENFNDGERKKILDNIDRDFKASNLEIKRTWGKQIEDRGSQITFSALGQQAPLEAKKVWDTNFCEAEKNSKTTGHNATRIFSTYEWRYFH